MVCILVRKSSPVLQGQQRGTLKLTGFFFCSIAAAQYSPMWFSLSGDVGEHKDALGLKGLALTC